MVGGGGRYEIDEWRWKVECAEPLTDWPRFCSVLLLRSASANSINCERRLWFGTRRLEYSTLLVSGEVLWVSSQRLMASRS